MIYFIQRITGGPIKIGTAIAVGQRIKILSCFYKTPFSVLAVIEGDQAVEFSLHTRFARLRIENEWFNPGPELTCFIKEHGKAWKGVDDPESNGIPRKVQVSLTLDQDVWDRLKEIERKTTAKVSSIANRILSEVLAKGDSLPSSTSPATPMEALSRSAVVMRSEDGSECLSVNTNIKSSSLESWMVAKRKKNSFTSFSRA